jgi:hypothetical protein
MTPFTGTCGNESGRIGYEGINEIIYSSGYLVDERRRMQQKQNQDVALSKMKVCQ